MNKAIFYFSATDYEFLTQRPQQLFKEWNASGAERAFFYIEPFRSEIHLRRSRFRGVLRSPFYFHFTKYGLPQLEPVNSFFIKQMVKRNWAGRRVAIPCTSVWEPYLDHSSFDVICYDYLDALEVHAGEKNFQLLKSRHERLLEKSDLVFVTAEKLRQEVCEAHPEKKVVTVSNGVDFDFFQQHRNAAIADYRAAGRKVVGYVGAIYDWIDLELVHQAARLTPEIDYVMVGPVSGKNRAVAESSPSNVYFLGPKPYHEVPAYIDRFDVCLIPFVQSNISESTDPIKLYEYFALGKPVLATSMRQLRRFDDGVKLRLCDDPVSFAAGIRELIEGDCPESRLARQEIARANSWKSKAELMLQSVNELAQGMA